MKKFLHLLFWVLLFTPPLTSCSDKDDPVDEPVRLSTPALSKSDVTKDAFTVRWAAVEHASGYVYTLDDGQQQTVDRTEIRIENLTASTQYTVRVKATSNDALYLESEWATIQITTTSGEHVLAVPANLTISEVKDTSFILSWDAVDNATGYVYVVGNGAEQTTSATSVTVTGLTPDTEYLIRLKATAEGDWEDSDWAGDTVRTLPSASDVPFTITVPEEELKAFSFTVRVTPKDATMPYYVSYLTDEEWEEMLGADGNLDEEALHEMDLSLMQLLAMLTGTTYPEILGEMTLTGTQDVGFDANPQTHYRVYAYGWGLDGNFLTKTVVGELTTPEAAVSTSTVTITYGEITSNSLQIICTPDPDVASYYQLFTSAAVVDDFYAEGGTEEEFKSIVMQQGYEVEGVDDYVWPDLAPETEYQMSIVGLDNAGGQFMVTSRKSTIARVKPDPVDSPLFDELLGDWTGKQTYTNANGTAETTFSVKAELTELSMNYREYNQIALKLTGFGGLSYYGGAQLVENEWTEEEAVEDYGPKLLLNVDADGSVWIDGSFNQPSFYNWSNAGKIYMFGCNGSEINPDHNFTVTVSEDYNTMTISYPVDGYYPSILYQGTGGWNISMLGNSDIVLTRGTAPASVVKTSAAKAVVKERNLQSAAVKRTHLDRSIDRSGAREQAPRQLPARIGRPVGNR